MAVTAALYRDDQTGRSVTDHISGLSGGARHSVRWLGAAFDEFEAVRQRIRGVRRH